MERPYTTAQRLRQIMDERALKQVDILNMSKPYANTYGIKLNRNDLSQYVSGKVAPGQHKLFLLAITLNVSEAWLMGFDMPPDRTPETSGDVDHDNILPIDVQRVPFLGEIACGEPIYANEEKESYVAAGTDIHADFCLRAKGDSMINARIMDGDIVFIRRQSMVDNGEIAAVIIDDEATLKRVYYDRNAGQLVLNPENPKFPPLVYTGEELNKIKILGKAVAFQSDVR